ncbi:MAG: aminoacyl-tRNA hydrolase [Bacteroidales bacterium]|nr:aminoacyl-tRNA hydrolase [Bacteroidales bacterium]
MENAYRFFTNELNSEFVFSFSRSSGPGGQNVNKVNTKVELRFNINNSTILSEYEKSIIISKLTKQISNDIELIVISQATRSQLSNKENAILKFYEIINTALKPQKKRKPTTVSKTAKEKRLKNKKVISEKKLRRNIKSDI